MEEHEHQTQIILMASLSSVSGLSTDSHSWLGQNRGVLQQVWPKLTSPQTEPRTGLDSGCPDPSAQASGVGRLHGQDWHQPPARESPGGR